jgi:hypothetical protein
LRNFAGPQPEQGVEPDSEYAVIRPESENTRR